ncbi:MAG: NAD(P)-dependent oxidoreductase [Candidatus Promineifilaceae bacterium]|nr:NAD(P)-dependent oxidoreductase [Candidatus Promineifilaceae bacterium]
MKVGFIGLGIMGSRMAANLQQGGVELVVHNRTAAKADPLLEDGAVWAESPADLAPQVSVLFTVLAHPQAVQETALGTDGFLDHLPADALWVDCTTVNPSFSRKMAAAARRRQARFVDAPVAGTKGPAAAGELLVLAGGTAEDVAECQPYLDLFGRKTVHVGEQGMGTALKMVLNLLLAQAMVAFSEGMALGQALGLDQPFLLDFLIGGAVVAPFVKGKRSKIEGADDETDFPLKWMAKDLHLAAVSAYEEDVALPQGAVARSVYTLAQRFGLGEADFSAVYRFLNQEQ